MEFEQIITDELINAYADYVDELITQADSDPVILGGLLESFVQDNIPKLADFNDTDWIQVANRLV
jgi:hypothetical protein